MAAPGDEPLARVRVPASSANLGPGFDALAAALDVYLEVEARPRTDRRVVSQGLGAGELPEDEGNLIWRAFAAYCDWASVAVPDVTLVARNAIPLERGMGSSAAAAVAGAALARSATQGIAGARSATRGGGRDRDLIELAAALEGHADNAAAAVLGGIVLCVEGDVRRFTPAETLRPVVCVPSSRQSTQEARGVLPGSIPLAEAAANGARTAAVLAGLTGAMAWHPEVLRDVLHEPARLALMKESGRLVEALRGAGVGACLSGAGPSVLAILPSAEPDALAAVRSGAGPDWEMLECGWDLAGAVAEPPVTAVRLR